MQRIVILLAATGICAGCFNDINQNPETKVQTPQEEIITSAMASRNTVGQEVLIVSKPAGADIVAGGTNLGQTPMLLKITEETNLVLQLEGYTRQAVILNSTSGPNLIVDLIPSVETTAGKDTHSKASSPATRPVRSANSSPSVKNVRSSKARTPATQSDQPVASKSPSISKPSEPDKPVPDSPSPTPSRGLKTMREVKDALSRGDIDRAGYSTYQSKIRAARTVELDQLKKDYREKKIDKETYRRRGREIRLKYEG